MKKQKIDGVNFHPEVEVYIVEQHPKIAVFVMGEEATSNPYLDVDQYNDFFEQKSITGLVVDCSAAKWKKGAA